MCNNHQHSLVFIIDSPFRSSHFSSFTPFQGDIFKGLGSLTEINTCAKDMQF